MPGIVLGVGNKKMKDTTPLPSTLVGETGRKTNHCKQLHWRVVQNRAEPVTYLARVIVFSARIFTSPQWGIA